jgi:hypothetical protein
VSASVRDSKSSRPRHAGNSLRPGRAENGDGGGGGDNSIKAEEQQQHFDDDGERLIASSFWLAD